MSDGLRNRFSRRRAACLGAAAAAAVIPFATPRAADKVYIGPSGLWSNADNWDFGSVPNPGDAVQLVQAGNTSTDVLYDDSVGGSNFASLITDYVGSDAVMSFTQTANPLTVTIEQVGYNGMGVMNLFGGTHTITGAGSNALYIGVNAGSSGTVNLNGGTLNVTDTAYVGYNGTGVLNHSSGSMAVNGFLALGGDPKGTATAGSGTYNFSDGTLNAGTLYVGLSGQGNVVHSGGVATVGAITLGYLPGSSGTYALSGGASLSVASVVTVGDRGSGDFEQTGGSHTNAGMVLGNAPGSSGIYRLSGGTLNVLTPEIIGSSGQGDFEQTGGTHTPDSLYHGLFAGSSASYLLDGDGSTLAVNSNEYIGFNAPATFTQLAGLHSIVYHIELGHYSTGSGTYTLSNGVLTTRSESIGYGSPANNLFTQSGGNNTATDFLTVGDQLGARGTYNMSGGSLNVNTLYTAWLGTGSFNQSDGTSTFDRIFVGTQPGSSGTVTLSGGWMQVNTSEDIGYQGNGTFTQTGGEHDLAGVMRISGNPGGVGTYNLGGGTFSSGSIENNGNFVMSGGATANVAGGLTGGGVTRLSGPDPATITTLTVAQFAQATLSIGDNSQVNVSSGANRATNTATTLTITGNGLLDLSNQNLLVDNKSTPESTIRQYLKNAYNADPTTGIGDWNGRGGITSSDAIASHNGSSPDFRISIGYVNGAYARDPLINGPLPGQESLPTNRILVRPALYGDLNLDGQVDDTDLAIFSGLGQYNQPTDKFGWFGGDLNHDGKVDDTDLQIFSGAGNYDGPTYGAPAHPAARSANSATPSLTSAGSVGDGVLDFAYDPATGDLKIHYDGDPRVTAAQPLQVIRLASIGGKFLAANFNEAAFGAGVTKNSNVLNGTASGSNSVPDGYDLGDVLPPGLALSDLTADLTLNWNVFGGGLTLKAGDVIVPEPAIIGLIGTGVLAMLSSRRRRRLRE